MYKTWKPLQHKLSNMNIDERAFFVETATIKEKQILKMYPEVFLLDEQLVPDNDDWFYHWFCWARGLGKTLAGLIWLNGLIRDGAEEVAIVGPDHNTLKKEILPVFFKILSLPITRQDLSAGIIEVNKSCLVKLYSSEYEIRGLNAEYGLAEEMAKWCDGNGEKIQDRWNVFNAGIRNKRAKPHPRILNVTTPKPFEILKKWQKSADSLDKSWSYSKMTIDDARFLSPSKKEQIIKELGSTRTGLQELYAEILFDTPGAYWTHEKLDETRAPLPSPLVKGPARNQPLTNDQLMGRTPIPVLDKSIPYLIRIVIGFDPAGSSEGDECGIIIAALYSNREAYVIEDCSGNYNPDEYAQLISDKYRQYDAAAVVVETNFGGKQTFLYVLRSKNAAMKVVPIHNSQGKTTRAEHISSLYYQNKVHHTSSLLKLENQMCEFNVHYTKSPDRLDALGLALTELFFPTDASGNKISILNLPQR